MKQRGRNKGDGYACRVNECLGPLQYVEAGQKEIFLELFGGDAKRFAAFHAHDDDIDYLETREQTEQNRKDRAARMIEQFCREIGLVHANEIHINPDLFSRVCRGLFYDAGLTLQKTAEHLSTTHQRVHEAVREQLTDRSIRPLCLPFVARPD